MGSLKKYIPSLFAVFQLGIGIADLTRPTSLIAAMDHIGMPHYILWILGVAKILGGVIILFVPNQILKEWAFAGFFIWATGGIASHVFSGDGLMEMAPLLAISTLLCISYFIRFKSSERPVF
jgi:hypothetical protein